MAGLADVEGHLTRTYRYSVTGELAYGAAAYENEYTYNGESYNPNIHSQYLRARYYSVVTASFLTEDSYLGDIREPLTLNRYNYCLGSYLNYADPSGFNPVIDFFKSIEQALNEGWQKIKKAWDNFWKADESSYSPLQTLPPGNYVSPTPAPTPSPTSSGAATTPMPLPGESSSVPTVMTPMPSPSNYIGAAGENAVGNSQKESCEPTNEVYALVGTAINPLTEDEKRSNARYIYNYLLQEGWTVEAISGLFGNIERESGFNPGVWNELNNANSAYGIVQWRPAKTKFFYWMDSEKGYDMQLSDDSLKTVCVNVVNDLATENPQVLMDLQLEYLIWSSQSTTHSDHREWIATEKYGSPYIMSYAEYIVSEHDVGELALVFHASYERSRDSETVKQERMQNAQDWYDYLMSIQN